VLELTGHVLPRALRRRFSLLFYNSRLAKPGQKSTQYASIATTYSILPLVMLQKSIHHFAIQILGAGYVCAEAID
jgi:hypothetical protein